MLLLYEVIQSDWGNGEERKERLEVAKYDAVQQRVNELDLIKRIYKENARSLLPFIYVILK